MLEKCCSVAKRNSETLNFFCRAVSPRAVLARGQRVAAKNISRKGQAIANDNAAAGASGKAATGRFEAPEKSHVQSSLSAPILLQTPPPVPRCPPGLCAATTPVPIPLRPAPFQRPAPASILHQREPQEIYQRDCKIECAIQHTHLPTYVML